MKKVAIVARAGTNRLAPFRDTEWEIWGLPWISYPRVDRYFELHSKGFYDSIGGGWLKEQRWIERAEKFAPDAEVWCDETRMGAFRNPVRYPIEDIQRSFPLAYLENSIAYMIALAIHEKREEIGLYGVHMFSGPEAELSQPSVAYWCGVAHGRGIGLHTPPGSPLFMSNWTDGRYGLGMGRRPKIISFAGVTPYE